MEEPRPGDELSEPVFFASAVVAPAFSSTYGEQSGGDQGAYMTDVVNEVTTHLTVPGAPRDRIQIVPLKGLPFAGAALLVVVLALGTDWKWLLMFVHVAGGGLWTAIDLFVGLVIGPIMGRLSLPARAEFASKFMPAMLIIMPTLVTMNLGSGFQLARQLGNLDSSSPNHAWVVASMLVVGVMAVIALGVLEPANIAVLFEMNKPVPNGERIGRLMKRFIYTAGITGVMQLATLIIMTRIATQ